MWQAEISFDGSFAPAGSLAKKHGVSLSAYPISTFEEMDVILVTFACTLFGDDQKKKKFVTAFKKDARVRFSEINDDFLIVQLVEPLSTKPVYSANIIHTKPIFISSKGKEMWSVASKEKFVLTQFYDVVHALRKAKLVSIKQKKVENISIAQIRLQITKKQKDALVLAITEGYYDNPRRTDVQTLAYISGLAFSTFQAHLRKAESKIIPSSFATLK